jgi:hypothetical protein
MFFPTCILTFDAFERPQTDADVVVLAGDIARPREAVAWAMEFAQPVLYVAGNHEFYGGSIEGTLAELKRLCEGTHVHLLDDSELVLEGVRFLGTTLWTDFGLFGAGERKAAATAEATRFLRDFSRIRRSESAIAPFTPEDAAALFDRHARWLETKLTEAYDGPDSGDHSPCSVASQYSPPFLGFAAECVLRLRPGTLGWRGLGTVLDSRSHP